jgi:hypothetical protein
MFKHYINLELKAFSSASGEKHWLKKFDGLLVVYFLLVFFSCGIAYPMLSETFRIKTAGYC